MKTYDRSLLFILGVLVVVFSSWQIVLAEEGPVAPGQGQDPGIIQESMTVEQAQGDDPAALEAERQAILLEQEGQYQTGHFDYLQGEVGEEIQPGEEVAQVVEGLNEDDQVAEGVPGDILPIEDPAVEDPEEAVPAIEADVFATELTAEQAEVARNHLDYKELDRLAKALEAIITARLAKEANEAFNAALEALDNATGEDMAAALEAARAAKAAKEAADAAKEAADVAAKKLGIVDPEAERARLLNKAQTACERSGNHTHRH